MAAVKLYRYLRLILSSVRRLGFFGFVVVGGLSFGLRLSPTGGIRPYQIAFRGFRWTLERRFGQIWLRWQHPEFQSFLSEISYSGTDVPRRFALYYLGHCLEQGAKTPLFHSFLQRSFNAHSSDLIKCEFPFRNEAVICVYAHQSITKLSLSRFTQETDIFFIGRGLKQDGKKVLDPDVRATIMTRQLLEARRRLSKNMLVGILPDGQQGTRHLTAPFFGKLRPFKPGLGTLAATTNAPVVPIWNTLSQDGIIYINKGKAFASDTNGDPEQRAMQYLTQYTTVLEHIYEKHPETVQRKFIKQFLGLDLRPQTDHLEPSEG